MITLIVLVISAVAYFAFSKSMLGKKFHGFIGAQFNSMLNDANDPVTKLQYIIDKNKQLIKDLSYQYADLRAEIDITSPKISKLKDEVYAQERKVQVAVENNDKEEGTQAITMLNSKKKLLSTLEEQLEKLTNTRDNLIKLRDKLKHKNDLAASEITVLKSRRDIANNLKGVSENLVDMDTDNGDIVEAIEKEIISDEYKIDDNLEVLNIDVTDDAAEKEWEKLVNKSK